MTNATSGAADGAERGVAELGRLSELRQELLRRLISSQEQERIRLARELHDGVGQTLTALRLLLPQVVQADPAARQSAATRFEQLTTEMAKELHRIAVGLRPTALDDLGLARMLEGYLAEWSAMTDVAVSTHFEGLQPRLPFVIETTVYRIVQEALSNVEKHARATSVSVIVEQRRGMLMAIIEDDGVGFVPDTVSTRVQANALGIPGMKERASLVDGTVEIESTPGAGTAVYLRLPIPDAVEG